jgi:hypothetical protein
VIERAFRKLEQFSLLLQQKALFLTHAKQWVPSSSKSSTRATMMQQVIRVATRATTVASRRFVAAGVNGRRGMATFYTKEHEYIRVEGKIGVVGITDFAQNELGDIAFAELPDVGMKLEKVRFVVVRKEPFLRGVPQFATTPSSLRARTRLSAACMARLSAACGGVRYAVPPAGHLSRARLLIEKNAMVSL